MPIEAVQIHTMPNAPEGANGVYLYNTAGAQGLTLGQLMIAVCARTGAILEGQSIGKMNQIGVDSESMKALGDIMEYIAKELPFGDSLHNLMIVAQYWASTKPELEALGVNPLPNAIGAYNERVELLKTIKKRMEDLSQMSQEDMIDLRSLINRRDVALTTATNLIRTLGVSISNTADKLTRT